MKKSKKLVLCILIVALITLSSITAYAAMCSHGQEYWDINETKTYQYIDPGICYETTHWDIECRICGETWEIESYRMTSHNWICEDLGHIPGETLHRYRNTCTQCGYSIITDEFCSLLH
ncbi:MAG: hypothetical protein PHN87_07470 [Clostridia bacterium]|nr:hypothetical protein [Clostridia bacterium]